MASWAAKRKAYYFLGLVMVFVVPIGIYLAREYYAPPSCFDQKQNQDEEGVDCGGSCVQLCETSSKELLIKWNRSFRISPGWYAAAAYIENKNTEAGIPEILYSFKLYDDENILVKEQVGKTYVAPGEVFLILEPSIYTAERTPARTFVEFEAYPLWERTTQEPVDTRVRIDNRQLTNIFITPRMEADVINLTLEDIHDIDILVILYDRNGNALAVNSTFIDTLKRDSTKKIVYTWPHPFDQEPVRIEMIPRVDPYQ